MDRYATITGLSKMKTTRILKNFELEVPKAEYSPSGHAGCAGCGGAALMRQVLKVLGPKVVVTNPAGCSGAYANLITVPLCRPLFVAGAAWARGIKAGLEVRGNMETQVLVWAGDGSTYDCGLQALSSAAEKNENFIYICYDNEGYMSTGMQRSSATPAGAWTSTTPVPNIKWESKKDIVSIMAAHRIPYIATATIAYPQDLIRKLTKAKLIRGFRFFNMLAPCPSGWRYAPNLTVKISRLAVQSRVFPLLEVEDGLRYVVQQPKRKVQVREYIKMQDRFAHLTEADVKDIQTMVDREWKYLLDRATALHEV